MNFRCKFRHRRSIRRPRFPVRMQNFGDLATFSVDFCILYSECPPYFYFRFLTWPRKYTTRANPHVDNSRQVWSWYDHPLPSYSVFVCWHVTTVTWPGDLDLLTLNSCRTWRVTWPTLPPSLKTLRLFVHELRIITVPIDYHRKCVRGHCACAESRDPWVGGQKQLHFRNPRYRFAYSLYNFGGSTMNIIKVICENNARPCVKKRMRFCACAKSRDVLKVP